MNSNNMRLVADVGGTNIRLALCEVGSTTIGEVSKLACANFTSLEEALHSYINGLPSAQNITEACLAVAGPVSTDNVKFTNLPWSFSQQSLKQAFNLSGLKIINDFAAVAQAIPQLSKDDYVQVGGKQRREDALILALGAGTGLGMATVAPTDYGYQSFAAEGGHATIAAQTQIEKNIVAHFAHGDDAAETLNREYFISGRGLQAIYEALGGEGKTPDQISTLAVETADPLCEKALEIFCGWLGSICGDQALSIGAQGGVFIAGGMVKQFLPFFLNSTFRERFESKGYMRGYLKEIPCYVITRSHVALLGTAATRIG